MIEIGLFVLIIGILITAIVVIFNLTTLHPLWIIGFLFILILPGMYAALTGAPFVPSDRKRRKNMLNLASITDQDIVYDLGCGDGRLVFSAAKAAKRAIGYELSIPLVLYGKLMSLFHPRATIKFGNIWKQDYSQATVIFCYLMPGAMKQFYKEIWPHLKSGTRVISNVFRMKELQPEKIEEKVYLYIKP